MKTRYILIATAALMMSACAKTVEQCQSEDILITIRAWQEGALDTKTAVLDGGSQVYWEPADEVKVFFNGTGGRFFSQNTDLAAIAKFSGTLNILIGANEGASSSNRTWGLYPYRADATSDGESVTTTLPASQTGRAGSFAKNTHICLAVSGGYDLAFYNVTGGLRFCLSHEGINSVTFQGNNGEALAGRIKTAFDGGVPVVLSVSDSESVLTLTAPGGGTFQAGKWYYLEALPVTLSKGFKMVFSKGGETAELSSTGAVSIKRGKYGSLADVDAGLVFQGSGGSGEGDEHVPGSVIQFKDLIAKYACVEKFDTDGDAEISYEEAAAVTSLSGLFTNWNTVTSFDEIKYFTSVTSTEGVFKGLTHLESITIPPFIINLGSFQGCTALKSVVLPDGLPSIPDLCFEGCTSLTSIVLPSNLSAIPYLCFGSCGSLKTVDLPASLVSIGEAAFDYCSSLDNVVLPEGLVSIGGAAFDDCQALRSIVIPSGVTSIESCVFRRCTSLTSVGFPSGLSSIGLGAFYGCSALDGIELPAGLKGIDEGAFKGCSSISSLLIPSGVKTIGKEAFRYCGGIVSLSLPECAIGQYAFGDCIGLQDIVLNGSTVATNAFYGCIGLTSIIIDGGSIGTYAFSECPSLSIVSIGEHTVLTDSAFSNCQSLQSVSVGSYSTIGECAFFGCTGLVEVTMEQGVSVGRYAFEGCTSIHSVVLPADLNSIPVGLFYECANLASITWPSNLTTIGDYAFYGCIVGDRYSDNSCFELPSSVTTIHSYAFSGVKHLIIPSTTLVSVDEGAFLKGLTRLYVPAGMVGMYKVRTNWSSYANQIIPISDYPANPYFPEAEAVDLGLSVKWASWNMGASAPEESGCYYAWGETEPNWNYKWSTYRWCNGSDSYFTKYNTISSYGIVDNKTVLDSQDDVASVNWGDNWRMPTQAELGELQNPKNCSWVWTTENGVQGYRVTSLIGGFTTKSIFLPAAGYMDGTSLRQKSKGAYGCSSASKLGVSNAFYLSLSSSSVNVNNTGSRFEGYTIRPVCSL